MINSRDIKDLHPTLQRGVQELIRRCNKLNLPILITQTYRDNEYQNFLFNKKPKVTNARGGFSMHNFKLAFDFCKNVKGQEYTDSKFFEQVGKIWVDMGGEWGGNWKSFPDKPHCQFTNGRPDSDIYNRRYTLPNDAKMKWELEQQVKDDYMLRNIKILMDGKEQTVTAILEKDQNYIKLVDLEKLGFKVYYDENKKMPVINKA